MDFSFSHPQYLIFLLIIPAMFFIHFLSLTSRKKTALKFANFDAISRIQGVDFFSKNLVILFLNIFIVLSLIFAISGLTLHTTMESSSFSYVIAIDSSQSMNANDLSPNRMDAAKETAVNFVENSPADIRFGVISFSGSSRIERDMTDKKDEVVMALKDIILSGYGGTDLYEAVLSSTILLKNDKQKSVILLSDGQINVGTIEEAISYANENDVIVHTIGIGTLEGGMTEYAISKLDEDSLKSLAYNTGGVYARIYDKENLTKFFSQALSLTQRKVSISLLEYLIIFAIVVLLIEFFLNNTKYVSLP